MPAGAQAVATQAAGPPETSAMSVPNMAEMMSDLTPDNCGAKIAELKRKALEMKKERREVAKQLKNTQKKQRRLKEKARQLTDEDLLSVILMRRGNKPVAGNPSQAEAPSEDPRNGARAASASNSVSPSEDRVDLERLASRMEL